MGVVSDLQLPKWGNKDNKSLASWVVSMTATNLLQKQTAVVVRKVPRQISTWIVWSPNENDIYGFAEVAVTDAHPHGSSETRN